MTEGVSAREWELSQRKFLLVFFFLSKIQIKFKFQGWPPTSQSKTRTEGRIFIYWFSMKHEKIVKEASHSAIHLPTSKIRCLLSSLLLLRQQKKGTHLQKRWIITQRSIVHWWESIQMISPKQNDFTPGDLGSLSWPLTGGLWEALEAARTATGLGNRTLVG